MLGHNHLQKQLLRCAVVFDCLTTRIQASQEMFPNQGEHTTLCLSTPACAHLQRNGLPLDWLAHCCHNLLVCVLFLRPGAGLPVLSSNTKVQNLISKQCVVLTKIYLSIYYLFVSDELTP